ncbi:hypothetical protein GOODEAATRI_003817 [Goodea atripinnis]|uniref:Uncharacterized protein n=1 Tax=Goodea atripinnis TaxID=208336 RepID=A0ABV0MYG7_9TELE
MVTGEHLSQQNGNNAERIANQKRLLFDTIAKYYNGQEKAALISGRYLDIHVAVLNLLGKIRKKVCRCRMTYEDTQHSVVVSKALFGFSDDGKTQDAIRASQLCLRLLETSVRDELRRLLAFMAVAAQSGACRIQKQVTYIELLFRTMNSLDPRVKPWYCFSWTIMLNSLRLNKTANFANPKIFHNQTYLLE